MKQLSITILFVLFYSAFLFPQDFLKAQYDYAFNLYEEENYFDAVTEFKRLIFFDEAKAYQYKAQLFTGKCYKAGGMYTEAIKHFTLANLAANDDNEFYESRIENVRAQILRRSTNQALMLLQALDDDKRYLDRKDEINYWRGWAYIFNDDFKSAAVIFNKINPEHELARLSEESDEKKYSESAAKILSVFIPGAGQFYTGNYLNGIISLGWNIFAGYLTVNSFIEERIFDGIITANLLWLRFYIGGIRSAEEFAEEKNLEVTNQAMDYLQYRYTGVKP